MDGWICVMLRGFVVSQMDGWTDGWMDLCKFEIGWMDRLL